MTMLTKNHLLYWAFKAMEEGQVEQEGSLVLTKMAWEELGAPDWVYNAMLERYKSYKGVQEDG